MKQSALVLAIFAALLLPDDASACRRRCARWHQRPCCNTASPQATLDPAALTELAAPTPDYSSQITDMIEKAVWIEVSGEDLGRFSVEAQKLRKPLRELLGKAGEEFKIGLIPHTFVWRPDFLVHFVDQEGKEIGRMKFWVTLGGEPRYGSTEVHFGNTEGRLPLGTRAIERFKKSLKPAR